MNSLFEDLKEGLTEAINYEKGLGADLPLARQKKQHTSLSQLKNSQIRK